MPTLSELARTQQTTTVGQAQNVSAQDVGGTSIQATQQIDNSAGLASDIGKMFGGIMQEHQQASEYAGKIVGTDNLVEYKKEMDSVAKLYADKADITSSDYIEKDRLEQGIYEHYMQKGHFGDNELANQAFKSTYASPATDHLLGTRTQNAKEKTTLYRAETKRDVSNDIEFLGSNISAENLDTFKTKFKSAGLDLNDVVDLYVTSAGKSLTSEINDNYSKYYDAGGNIRQGKVDALINEKYKHVINTDNETLKGDIANVDKAANAFISTKANTAKTEYTNEAIHRAKSLMYEDTPYIDKNGRDYRFASFSDYEKTIDKEFPLLTSENRNQIMAMYDAGKEAGSSNMAAFISDWKWKAENEVKKMYENMQFVTPDKIQTMKEGYMNIQMSGLSTPLQKQNATNTFKDIQIIENNYNHIQGNINSLYNGTLSIPDARALISKGSQLNGFAITSEQQRAVWDNELSTLTLSTEKMDVSTAEGEVSFAKSLDKLSKVQSVVTAGEKPKIFNKYDSVLKDRNGFKNFSANDMRQFVVYMDYQFEQSSDKQYDNYKSNVAQLKYFMADQDKDTDTSQSVKDMQLKTKAMTTMRWSERPANAGKLFKDAMDDLSTGNNRWSLVFNTDVAYGLGQTMQSMYYGSYDEKSIQEYLNSFETYDVPSRWGTWDNLRILKPNGMKDSEVTALIDKYTEPEGITLNDISFKAIKSEGGNLIYEVKRKGTNGNLQTLGNISPSAFNRLEKGRYSGQ